MTSGGSTPPPPFDIEREASWASTTSTERGQKRGCPRISPPSSPLASFLVKRKRLARCLATTPSVGLKGGIDPQCPMFPSLPLPPSAASPQTATDTTRRHPPSRLLLPGQPPFSLAPRESAYGSNIPSLPHDDSSNMTLDFADISMSDSPSAEPVSPMSRFLLSRQHSHNNTTATTTSTHPSDTEPPSPSCDSSMMMSMTPVSAPTHHRSREAPAASFGFHLDDVSTMGSPISHSPQDAPPHV